MIVARVRLSSPTTPIHTYNAQNERWSFLRSDLQMAHDLVHMTFLLLAANEVFVWHARLGQLGIDASLLEHLDDHSQAGALAL